MSEEKGYWTEGSGLLNRRRVLRAAAVSGASLAAATTLACTTTPSNSTQSTTQNAQATATPQAKRGGTLVHLSPNSGVYSVGYDPHTTGGSEAGLMGLFYQNLIRLKPQTYDIEPEIAQKWEQPGPTEYIFSLAPNVKWQNRAPVNGRALTADDVVFSYRRIGSSDPRFVNKSLLANIDKIEAIGKDKVRFTSKEPDVTTLNNIADWTALILAPEVVEKADRIVSPDSAVGTGPFVLQSADDVSATLVRNPDYWKSGLPYLDSMRIVSIKDTQAQWAAFLAGQIDIATVPGQEAKKFLGDQGKTYFTDWYRDVIIQHLWQNTKKKPFDDPRVTRALRLMMDHQEFISGWVEVWFGPGSGGLISHLPHALGAWDYTQEEYSQAKTPLFLEWKQPKDDAAKEALSLLSAAGFTKDNPLKFEHTSIPGTWEPALAQLMQAQWNRFGQGAVQSNLQLVDNGTLRTRQSRGEFEVSGPIGRGTVIDPDQIRQYYHTSGGNNFGKYSDPKVDQMFDRQRAIFDAQQRKPAVKELVTYLIQNAPYVGPTWRDQLTAAHPKVKNFVAENVNTIHGFLYETVWIDS